MDPAARDPLLRALAYLHPAWMVLSLLLAFAALRLGLRIRRARAARTPLRAVRAAHLRVARPAVVLLVAGLVGGPLSAVWLRGWEPLRTFHGVAGLLAGALFVVAAVQGRRLERGDGGARAAHARAAALASLVAAVAAVAGFVLLP
ncbi:MAG: DUF4079 family protein [Myxococcota bacterium]